MSKLLSAKLLLFIAIFGSVNFALGYLIAANSIKTLPGKQEAIVSSVPSISECIRERTSNVTILDQKIAREWVDFCNFYISSQNEANEYVIRRLGFMRQNYADPVILWMVVAITASGVLLAAIQMIASMYLLVRRGYDTILSSELTLQQDKLTIKSSITGLTILAISFAFFLTFVWKIYPVTETDIPKATSLNETYSQELRSGGIGPAPTPHIVGPETSKQRSNK